MKEEFVQQFDALIEKYSELLVGENSADVKEKVKVWALYSHIAKSMPALIKHWNTLYPDGKEDVKQLINEIKQMNEQHRSSSKK